MILKRIIDIVIAAIAIFLIFPVFLIVCYKVRNNLGSPIFFLQERPETGEEISEEIKQVHF